MDFGISSVSLSATHEEEEEEEEEEEDEEEEESQPPLKVFVSQFPIRALPSIDSDNETSIYIDDDDQPFHVSSSSHSSSSVGVSSNSDQSDGFLSGDEEFDEIERTFVVDPDDDDDEGTLVEISNQVGFSDSLPGKILMPPKARVSVEDDDEGFVSDVEEDGFSGVVGGLWECDNIVGIIPKVRVSSSDKEEYDDDDDDGVAGIDFMGNSNCKINDQVIRSSNGSLVANTGKDVLGIVSEEEEELLLIENSIPILDLVVEDAEGSSSVVVGVQEQEVIEVKEEKINESLGVVDNCVNVDCSNGGDSVLVDITGLEETEVSDIQCEDVPVGKDMVLVIDQLDVNPVVKELVDSNSGCMNVMNEGGPFVEVKKMCLPGLDTSHIEEENEFSEKKATEVLVKTSMMRLDNQSDQELFDVDSKSVGTDFGEGNSFVDDIKSVQNLECIITNPAIEILEQASFAIEEKYDCEKNCGGFVGSISKHLENSGDSVIVQRDELKHPVCCNTLRRASILRSILEPKVKQDSEDEVNSDRDNGKELEGSISDEDAEVVKCGDGYENFEEIVRESVQGSGVNHHLGAESSREDQSHKNNGHMAMEFDKEVLDNDEVGDKKDLLDLSMLAALPNAASSAVSHRGNIGMTSSDGLIISSVKHSAGLGHSIISLQPTPRPTQSNCVPTEIKLGEEFEENMTAEAKKRLDTIKLMRVKFLRLLQRLGHSPEDTTAEQVLHQLFLATGRRTSQAFELETARRTALQLDTEGKDDLNLSLNILVLGKVGMGKSATINSLFGEEKTRIDAFEPATAAVKEIIGTVHGVKIRVFDTPGLRTSVMEQPFNRKVLSSVKKFMKKCSPDIVFYVDRLDIQTRELNDIPLLRSITDTLGLPIWASVILILTHAASDPPDGPFGSPLSYEAFVTHRSLAVQHSIRGAVGDQLHMMIPVSLVENHCLGRSKEDHKVLPNDQNWSAKHGEDGSTLAGFNIQTIGKQLAYISRSETKFKYMKANKSSAGVSITFLDKNVATGLKVENQISIGKKLVLMGSTGAVRSRGDVVYGANLEARLKENEYPIGQDQSTLQLSLVKWKGGLEFRTNLQSQFSVGRSSKIAVGLGLNKHSSQITIRTTSSDQLQIALVGVLSIAIAIFRSIWPGNG